MKIFDELFMANNLNQSTYLEDEIDLRDILKVLIESKKTVYFLRNLKNDCKIFLHSCSRTRPLTDI